MPLGSPLNYGDGWNGYSSLGYCFGGSNISNLGYGYGGSFCRPWDSGSGFGYSTYWWTMAADDYRTLRSLLCTEQPEKQSLSSCFQICLRDTSSIFSLTSCWNPGLWWCWTSHPGIKCWTGTHLQLKQDIFFQYTWIFTSEAGSLSLMIALPMYH